jgi:oligosaccharyltransferase complex subunit delta (ribophorin II)
MGFQSLFSALLCFIAAAHAAQLTVRSPRLTIFGPDGSQLSSEQYATHFLITRMESNNQNRISLTKRPDPITLGPTDTLKLTFQVAEEATDNGVQPHQTFLRFFDSTTGEEGIQPVKIAPSGKAKFELVRRFVL